VSGPAVDGNGGLFTEYVVQGLGTGSADIDGNGQVSLDELSQWVKPRVAQAAAAQHREQHPNLIAGSALGATSGFTVE
jgi:hypothetical protein